MERDEGENENWDLVKYGSQNITAIDGSLAELESNWTIKQKLVMHPGLRRTGLISPFRPKWNMRGKREM